MSRNGLQRSMVGISFVLFESQVFRAEIIYEFDETFDLLRGPLVRLLLGGWKVIHESAFGTHHRRWQKPVSQRNLSVSSTGWARERSSFRVNRSAQLVPVSR